MKLTVERVSKRLGGRPVLRDVALECGGAVALAIFGENGAGKSTLLRIISGIVRPDAGTVRLDGVALDAGGRAARRHLGYVPETADPLPHLTVGELLALFAALKQAPPPAPALLEELHVAPLLGQRIGTLSLGQRRRVGLVAALIASPWLLILDEPTNGLDPEGVAGLVALLGRHVAGGGAVLLATHDHAFAAALGATGQRLHAGSLGMEPAAG